jgi:hypothetical protein
MSLAAEYHAAHKERLARLSPVVTFTPKVQPYPHNTGWEEMWFWDLICPQSHAPKKYFIKDILTAVSDHYCIDEIDITSARRTGDLVLPRHVAMYLAKQLTQRSLPEIGRMFGQRDHTTILYAVRKIARKAQTDDVLRLAISEIRRKLG